MIRPRQVPNNSRRKRKNTRTISPFLKYFRREVTRLGKEKKNKKVKLRNLKRINFKSKKSEKKMIRQTQFGSSIQKGKVRTLAE